jgi:NDP-sugar pyrophosphorylase family protein
MHYGITNIVLSLGYLGELIQAYFENANGRFANLDLTEDYALAQREFETMKDQLLPQTNADYLKGNKNVDRIAV